MKNKYSKREEDYYCNRCKIDSFTKNRICPCPRGSCDAKIRGKVVTTVEVIVDNKN